MISPRPCPGRRGAEERAPTEAGRKQRSWLSGLSATGRPAARASSRTCVLGEPPEGEGEPLELLRHEPGEHVGLVLRRIGARHLAEGRGRPDRAGVVPGDETRRAKRARPGPAARRSARGRCSARTGWACGRRRSSARKSATTPPEALGAGRGSGAGGPCGGPGRARRRPPAASSSCAPVGGRIGPQLQRHGDHLVAGVEGQQGGGALSTPPLIATSVRRGDGGKSLAPSRAAAPTARCSASAAS